MGKIISNGINYSGLINAQGVFIDTDNVIVDSTIFHSSLSYTASVDCFVYLYVVTNGPNNGVSVKINGKDVFTPWNSGVDGPSCIIPVRKGQILSVLNAHSSYDSIYAVYGVKHGSEGSSTVVEFGGGMFIDTSNVIVNDVAVNEGSITSSTLSYTATQDCYFIIFFNKNTAYDRAIVCIDGKEVYRIHGENDLRKYGFYVKKGQIVSASNLGTWVYYTVYGVTYTTQTLQPVIYSEEEREIGVWTDGKPLYQKTIHIQNTVSSFSDYINGVYMPEANTVISMNFIALRNVDGRIIQICGNAMSRAEGDTNYMIGLRMLNGYLQYRCDTYGSAITDIYVTLQYTKTTDTAGSGIWTPSGVPAVHYSTDEHVVGTWIDGKTIYEKTWLATIPNIDSQIGGALIASGFIDFDDIIDIKGRLKGTVKAYGTLNGMSNTNGWQGNIHINTSGDILLYGNMSDLASLIGGNAIVTIRYTKSTD